MSDKQFLGDVMELAWTAMGEASLYIETSRIRTKIERSGFITTGQIGSVMEEGIKIVQTLDRTKVHATDPEIKFFR